MNEETKSFVAFAGGEIIARGALAEVALLGKARFDGGDDARIAIYDDASGGVIDIDFSGRTADVLARLAAHSTAGAGDHAADPGDAESSGANQTEAPDEIEPDKPRGRGRPKLGVVAREVTLLPRHWEWLGDQRGGASAALRRLVDAARKTGGGSDEQHQTIEAAHRFMWDIAGDLPGFEDAARALFAMDFASFSERISGWPSGVREQLARFLKRAESMPA
ncbi:MAG: DUF2239 family protein [Rhodospirillaceae bacterium]|nr:DUF2239 family protein [Rhodospirillaceae bacterium]